MILRLDEIDAAPVAFDTGLELPELRNDTGGALVVGPLAFAGTVCRGLRGVELAASWRATVALPCSRCLEPHEATLAEPVFLVFTVGPEASVPGEQAMDLDEACVFRVDEPRVDLRAVAAEQVQLALPLKPLCRPDCAGLCATCGANRNRIECGCRPEEVDPRLAALRDLLE